jgi:hypothetical protein
MALALSACTTTTVSRDEAFSGGSGQSYVLIATDTNEPNKGTETFTFQRVDLASSTFLRNFVSVTFSAVNIFTATAQKGTQFERSGTAPDSLRFAGKKIPPGDYALVYHTVYHPGSVSNFNCYANGAAIYRIRDGSINIVRQGKSTDIKSFLSGAAVAVEVRDPAALQSQVAEVLARYPKMTAPTVVAQLLGTASFETGKTWFGDKTCNPSGAFTFKNLPPTNWFLRR